MIKITTRAGISLCDHRSIPARTPNETIAMVNAIKTLANNRLRGRLKEVSQSVIAGMEETVAKLDRQNAMIQPATIA